MEPLVIDDPAEQRVTLSVPGATRAADSLRLNQDRLKSPTRRNRH
jgi:hypothetical protein